MKKRKVRKPRPFIRKIISEYLPGLNKYYTLKLHVDDKRALTVFKKLHAWLTKAIRYLEEKEK